MAISLKHSFTSPKADGPDSTLVQPSNWNAEHEITMAASRILGRTTAGAGNVEELAVGSNLLLASGSLNLASSVSITALTASGAITGGSVSAPTVAATTSVTTPLVTSAGNLTVSATGANVINLATNGADRLRIDENGMLRTYGAGITLAAVTDTPKILATTGASTNTGTLCFESVAVATSTRHHMAFVNPNGVVGSISTSASATAYNTSSDYRLKEGVEPLTFASERVMALNPVQFNWKSDPAGPKVDGFIAHEAQAVVPEAVTGIKDAVDDNGRPAYQGIDQSKLVPLLTAALQEALAKIGDLEVRLQTLESR
jgi:hypothetical protein